MTNVPLIANDPAANFTSDVKPFLGEAIDVAFEYRAAECARQCEMRDTLLENAQLTTRTHPFPSFL